jgi:hypothetical protein
LSEEKIQKIMRDTTSSNGGFLDIGETDGGKLMLSRIGVSHLHLYSG